MTRHRTRYAVRQVPLLTTAPLLPDCSVSPNYSVSRKLLHDTTSNTVYAVRQFFSFPFARGVSLLSASLLIDHLRSHRPLTLRFSPAIPLLLTAPLLPLTIVHSICYVFFHRCDCDHHMFSTAVVTTFSIPNLRLTTSASFIDVQQRCVRQGSLPSNCGPFPPVTKIC